MPAKNHREKSAGRYEYAAGRLEVKDYFLQRAVREIYDNSGQLLSLVRVNLALVEKKLPGNEYDGLLKETGSLVGRIIRDLRRMTAYFTPENILSERKGWVEAYGQLVQRYLPGIPVKFTEDIEAYWLSDANAILLFAILLGLLELPGAPEEASLLESALVIRQKELAVVVRARGDSAQLNTKGGAAVKRRVRMLGGKLIVKTGERNAYTVSLQIPLTAKL